MPSLADKLDELRHELDQKKEALAKAVSKLIQEFLDGTGFRIKSLKVNYIETTAMDDPRHEYVVNGIEIETDRDCGETYRV